MPTIPEFTDHELWIVRNALEERFGEPVEPDVAESELRLDPFSSELTPCPTLFWEMHECKFVIFKTGDKRYRCMFFYRVREQFGTGIDEYDDLTECVVTLLQVQADHERDKAQREEKDQG